VRKITLGDTGNWLPVCEAPEGKRSTSALFGAFRLITGRFDAHGKELVGLRARTAARQVRRSSVGCARSPAIDGNGRTAVETVERGRAKRNGRVCWDISDGFPAKCLKLQDRQFTFGLIFALLRQALPAGWSWQFMRYSSGRSACSHCGPQKTAVLRWRSLSCET
jgi:hypothetical protein